jgi:hypothetical protein
LWHNPAPFLILKLAENRLLFRASLRSSYVSQTEDPISNYPLITNNQ